MLTQLTQEQVRAKSDEKVAKIRALCEELQVTFTSKQRLDPQTMILENIVIFTDNENYPVAIEKSPAQTTEELNNEVVEPAGEINNVVVVEPAEEKTDVEPANI